MKIKKTGEMKHVVFDEINVSINLKGEATMKFLKDCEIVHSADFGIVTPNLGFGMCGIYGEFDLETIELEAEE